MSLSRWRLRVQMASDVSYMGKQRRITRPLMDSREGEAQRGSKNHKGED